MSRGACWPFRSAVLEGQGIADTLRQAVYTTDKKKSQKWDCENTILISHFFELKTPLFIAAISFHHVLALYFIFKYNSVLKAYQSNF